MASKVAEGYIEMRVDQARLQQDLGTARGAVTSTFQSLASGAMSASGTMQGALGGILGAQALSFLASEAKNVGASFIGANAQAETFAVSLQAMTGSAEAGAKMFNQLRQFAMGTPFQLAGLTSATQKLLAFGYGADEVIPILRGVGDVASAMPEGAAQGMQRVIDVLGQMRTMGQVSGREMRQLSMAGIPIWQGLAQVMGTDVAGAQKAVTAGTVDAAMGLQAMMAVAKDPRFAGMMGKLSQTFEGAMSNFRDLSWQIAGEMGEPIFDVVKQSVLDLIGYLQSDAGKGLVESFRSIFGGIANMIRPIVPVLITVGPAIATAGAALAGIALVAPSLGTAFGAIASAAGFFVSLPGLLVGIPAALGIALVSLEDFQNGFMSAWPLIKEAASELMDFLSSAWSDVFNGVRGFITDNSGTFRTWGALVAEIMAGTIKTITALLRGFWEFATWVWNQIKGTVATVWKAVSGFITRALEEISYTLSDWSGTMNLVWTQIALWAVEAFDAITDTFMELAGLAVGTTASIGGAFAALWNNIVAGVEAMVNGVRAHFAALAAATRAMLSGNDPLEAFRKSYNREFNRLSAQSRQFQDIGEEAGKAFTGGYDLVMKDHQKGSALQDELRSQRDSLLAQRAAALEAAREARRATLGLPGAPGGAGEDKGGAGPTKKGDLPKSIEVKIAYVGLSEMWKKVQESVAKTGTQDLAKRTAIGAERTAVAAEETAVGMREVRDAVKGINTGLA